MSLRLTLTIQRATRSQLLPGDALLRRYARAALQDCQRVSLTIRIVGEKESQQLNAQYRHKDKPTNVLSFPCSAPVEQTDAYLGDLVICAKVVQQEALAQGKPLKHHWAHMVIHGCLHLRGFDHEKSKEAVKMEAMERRILASINIPDPYLLER